MIRHALAALALALAAAPLPAQQTGDHFSWNGSVPAGRWIRVRNLNGAITVGVASGDQVQVTATKHYRRGNPDEVHFDVQHVGAGQQDVLICALWGDRATCDEEGYHSRESRGSRNNDTSVEFQVLVPKGVRVAVGTVNGDVRVDGATSDVDASSVNGSVEAASSGGPVNGSSVNGDVRAHMGRFPLRDDLSLTTVNGSVSAEFTGDLDADIELSTVNGRFYTDYPVTVNGRLEPRNVRARIGKGGPRVRLTTVNGSVELRRRS